MRFFSYVILLQGISIEDEKIKAVKDWLKPKSIRDIQVFIWFANFYKRFIQGFSKIAASLILILKILASDTNNTIGNKKRNYSDYKISKITKFKNVSSKLVFLTLKARLAFTQLR